MYTEIKGENGMKILFKTIAQIGLLLLFASAGNWIAAFLHLPVSGSIIGIALVFILLRIKVIRLDWVESGANWLIRHLLLFFIPAAVGIVQYTDVMARDGSRFLLVILFGTAAVMTCTGLMADYIYRKRRHQHDSDISGHAAANPSNLPRRRPSLRPPQ